MHITYPGHMTKMNHIYFSFDCIFTLRRSIVVHGFLLNIAAVITIESFVAISLVCDSELVDTRNLPNNCTSHISKM